MIFSSEGFCKLLFLCDLFQILGVALLGVFLAPITADDVSIIMIEDVYV